MKGCNDQLYTYIYVDLYSFENENGPTIMDKAGTYRTMTINFFYPLFMKWMWMRLVGSTLWHQTFNDRLISRIGDRKGAAIWNRWIKETFYVNKPEWVEHLKANIFDAIVEMQLSTHLKITTEYGTVRPATKAVWMKEYSISNRINSTSQQNNKFGKISNYFYIFKFKLLNGPLYTFNCHAFP